MKENIATITGIVIVFGFWMVIGYTIGYTRGMTDTYEAVKESDCRYEYASEPMSEVPVKCLKYFELEQK